MDSKKAVIKTEGQSPLSHHFHCRELLLSLPLTPVPRVIITQNLSLKIDHFNHGYHMTDTWHAKI